MHQLPAFPSRVTHVEAPACWQACETALRQVPAGTVAELDLGALQHFDSSALALVLALLRSAQHDEVELRLHAVPPRLRDLTVVYGVGDLLP